MKVTLEDIGKRYASKHWVFKNFNQTVHPGDRIAITGGNGSGKSTLLQIIGGLLNPSAGQLEYFSADQSIPKEQALQQINFAAPYMELIQEFTVMELLRFHFKFRTLVGVDTLQSLVEILYLEGNEDKWVKNLSSGMKQRLKLGLTFFSASPLILLDEPTTNLDEKGITWYHQQIKALPTHTSVLIASNQKQEYHFCDKIICMQKEFSK